jgi:hypothetical protein
LQTFCKLLLKLLLNQLQSFKFLLRLLFELFTRLELWQQRITNAVSSEVYTRFNRVYFCLEFTDNDPMKVVELESLLQVIVNDSQSFIFTPS